MNGRPATGFLALCKGEFAARGFGNEGLIRAEGLDLEPVKPAVEHAELEGVGQTEFG